MKKTLLIVISILILILITACNADNTLSSNSNTSENTSISNEITEATTHEREVKSPGDLEICNDYYNPNSEHILVSPKGDIGTLAENDDLQKLKQFKNLKSLITILGNEQYKYLLDLPHLNELEIMQTNITEEYKILFSNLKELDSLYFDYCNCENNNLDVLKECTSLKKFKIYGSIKLDISAISQLKNLEYLDFSIWEIAEYTPLYTLKNLKELGVPESISKDELKKLQYKLPNCKIYTTIC